MNERLTYPRAFAVVRSVLYLLAAVAAVGIGGVAVSFLSLLFGVSALTLLVNGEVSVLAVGALFGFVFLAVALLLGGLLTGVRRADRALRSALSGPSAVDRVKQGYVDAEFDEPELERRLDDLLGSELAATGDRDGGRRRSTHNHGSLDADAPRTNLDVDTA